MAPCSLPICWLRARWRLGHGRVFADAAEPPVEQEEEDESDEESDADTE